MTRILLISGSTREGSLHTSALRAAARLAPPGISTILYDQLRHLPAFVPGEPALPGAVTALRQSVEEADAVLFSTPEYAGSLPGTLKNLLDWLIAGGDLVGKPAAWLSVAAPGQDDGALAALEAVLANGNARLLKAACIRVPVSPEAVDADGVVDDPRLTMALTDTLRALGRLLAVPDPRKQPNWQAYSSVFPVVMRRDPTVTRHGRHGL
ncbi:NADPH-dependent FMN reductase [Actinoplanes friuliensis]|uniref:NADPH azoreductase n=1 Tax=Actinoplanes friuliensis DSM 7358 TaxID=1246995 RepID=U5VY64_9ACTN|nr:NADPH-dependent FMN reductase [Actinoplanes friuliensis]AGZ41722.1 NADPH azoreductase [Actinoplanes friuliensis DSM 7358]